MTQTERDIDEKDDKKTVHVTVHNEDDGDTYKISAKRDDDLALAIDRIYKKARRDRQPDDRLRCEGNGEDVFPFEQESFDRYLDDGHCAELVWLFAAGTGGA